MKILTWNLSFWLHRSDHERAWDFLCNILKPNLALLQEVKPPPWIHPGNIVFNEFRGGWGTAIYAPSLGLSKEQFSLHPGRVVLASAKSDPDSSLLVASIHAPIIKDRVFPHLAHIFEELEQKARGRAAVVGGDLNSARLAEKVWPGYGHGPFFERIDKGDPWVDCCRRFHATEVQTFFGDSCSHPFQDDHIFASGDLSPRVRSCNVIVNDLTRSVSDHVPLVVELDL